MAHGEHPNPSSEQHLYRPSLPVDQSSSWKGFIACAIVLSIIMYWILVPIWPNITTHILGDAETDAIRGMWGFNHIQRSLLPPDTPFWSSQLNFHAGVVALMLPFTTGIVLAPIGLILGPVLGWNIGVYLMFLSYGCATAWLAKNLTHSWSAGLFAGAISMCQPMLIYAMADGTPEHISMWGMPLFLGLTIIAAQTASNRSAIFAGIAAILLVFDSPYTVVYTAVAGLIVLPSAVLNGLRKQDRNELMWTAGIFVSCIVVGAVLILSIYQFFPFESANPSEQMSLWQMNSADLRTWWQYEYQPSSARQTGLAPTTIPFPILWMALTLTAIGAPRSLPWFGGGLLMIALSLGFNSRLPVHLSHWMGPMGVGMGSAILKINSLLYALPGLGEIRFPQRWLVPAAFMIMIGSSFGLARLYQLKALRPYAFGTSCVLAAIGAFLCVKSSQIDILFPMQALPKAQFAEWIADRPSGGALITLPQMRPPPASGKRADLAVFANIHDDLSSSDVQYFQTIHGRPIYSSPSLKTLYKCEGNKSIDQLMRNWDDLALPEVTGNAIPASATDPRSKGRRDAALRSFIQSGLRWIVVDKGAYNEEAMGILRDQMGDQVIDERHFDEGDGVIVFELW